MDINWGQAGTSTLILYVLWDVIKKTIEYFSGNDSRKSSSEQIHQLIDIIANKDQSENAKIKELVGTVKDTNKKIDTLVVALHENSASNIQTRVRDETNTNRTIQILEKLEVSQRRIHDRIDEIKEKTTAIEIQTRSCIRRTDNEQRTG